MAQTMQSYGGWGLSAILMGVCGLLFRALMSARDKNDTTLEVQVRGAIDMVEASTTAHVELRHALDKVGEALKAIERRLENVEKG